MSSAQHLIDIAREEIGYLEDPPDSNKTKYAKEVGHLNGQAWCQTFCNAAAKAAGVELPEGVREIAYTPTAVNLFKAAGQWSTEPAAGAFTYFDFPDAKKRVQHVGILTTWNANFVWCIEGNTSKGVRGSQDNGGGVFLRKRPRAHVVGYGLPLFTATTTDTPAPVTAPNVQEDDDMPKPEYVVGKLTNPAGDGVWLLTFDGGVRTKGAAKFYGSIPGLKPEQRQGFVGAYIIEPFRDGYAITDVVGNVFHFPGR